MHTPIETGDAVLQAADATTFDWVLLGFYASLALGVSFLCSLLEAALLSISRPRIALLIESGRRSGTMLQGMKDNVDRPLAAILTLNTVAHTMGAAGIGAQVLVLFGSTWVAAASVIATLLILVLSEIIPKTLGAVHAYRLADFTAASIRVIILLTWPIVFVLELISRRIGGGKVARVTREEIRITAEMGAAAGALELKESRVIRNLLRLRDLRVADVMTPRTVMFALPHDDTVSAVVARHESIPFSRIPVYEGTPDSITGVVLKHELLSAAQNGDPDHAVDRLKRPVHVIPEVASVADALDEFIQRGEHLFQVVDEFGGTAGILTMEDAMETLLGVEIVDETDSVEDMRELARKHMERRWTQREWRSL